MSESSYYIHREYAERSDKTGLRASRVVATCICLGLGAAAYACPWTSQQGTPASLRSKASAVNMPATKPANTGRLARDFTRSRHPLPRAGATVASPYAPKAGLKSRLELPRRRGFAAAQAVPNKEDTFNYDSTVAFDFESVKASQLQELLKEGWILLDVRPDEQVARAKVQGSIQVPVYVLKEDYSPYGLYQEAAAWGLGGWWMGGRPMKENSNFAAQVREKVGEDVPGIIAVCQTGLRARQAVKQLYLAGFKQKLAVIEGGYERAKAEDLCGGSTSCIVPEGAKLYLAGSGNVAGFLGWRAT